MATKTRPVGKASESISHVNAETIGVDRASKVSSKISALPALPRDRSSDILADGQSVSRVFVI